MVFGAVALVVAPSLVSAAFELRPSQLGIASPAWPSFQEDPRAGVVHFRPFGLSSVRFDGVHGQAAGSLRLARLLAGSYQEWTASLALPVLSGPRSRLTLEGEWMRTQPPESWPGLTARQVVTGGLEWRRQINARLTTQGWGRELGWGRARRPLGLAWKAGLGVSAKVSPVVRASAAVERSGLGRTRRELELRGTVGRHLGLGYRWSDGAQTQSAEFTVSPLVVGVWRTSYPHIAASHGLRLSLRRETEVGAVPETAVPVGVALPAGIRPNPSPQRSMLRENGSRSAAPHPSHVPLANLPISFPRFLSRTLPARFPEVSASVRSTWFEEKRSDRWRVDIRRGATGIGAGHSPGRDPWVRLRTRRADFGLDAAWGLSASRSSEIASRSPSLRHRLGPSLLRPGRGTIALSIPVSSRARLWAALDPRRTRTGVSVRGVQSSFGLDYSSLYESRLWMNWGSEGNRFGFDLVGRRWQSAMVRGMWTFRAPAFGHQIRTRLRIQDRLGSSPRVGRLSDPTALWRRIEGEVGLRRGGFSSRVTFDDRRSRAGPEPWDATRRTTRVLVDLEFRRPEYQVETTLVFKETARRARGSGVDPGSGSFDSDGRGWFRLERPGGPSSPGLEIGWQERSRQPGRWWGLWWAERVRGFVFHGAVAESWSRSGQSVSVPLGGFGPRRRVPSPGAFWTAGAEVRRGPWAYKIHAAGGESGQSRWGPEFRSALRLRWGQK